MFSFKDEKQMKKQTDLELFAYRVWDWLLGEIQGFIVNVGIEFSPRFVRSIRRIAGGAVLTRIRPESEVSQTQRGYVHQWQAVASSRHSKTGKNFVLEPPDGCMCSCHTRTRRGASKPLGSRRSFCRVGADYLTLWVLDALIPISIEVSWCHWLSYHGGD